MLMLDQTPLTSTPTCGRNHRNGRAVWTETGGRFPPKSEGGFRRNMQSGLRVSHEAIYQAVYAVPRGELRRELLACQGKPQRGRRSKDGERRGRICDMTSIRE